jgi:hypothetical protein
MSERDDESPGVRWARRRWEARQRAEGARRRAGEAAALRREQEEMTVADSRPTGSTLQQPGRAAELAERSGRAEAEVDREPVEQMGPEQPS